YKWIDENGVAHYTTDRERIPASIRDRVIQGGSGARSGDWLRRDAGEPATRPAPASPAPTAATPAAPPARPPERIELPEETDGVHAVEATPDWSQAPGAEAQWEPGDLGEETEGVPPPAQPPAPAQARPASAAVPARASEPSGTLAADEAPIAPPAAPAAPRPAAAEDAQATEYEGELAGAEPEAPAAVAAPAPRPLGSDERAELADLDARIAEVEAKIARDEETLLELISAQESARHEVLVDDPRFRDIAQRLPRLQADLERLRERRAQIEPAAPRP
ncbi:MAG TPA: hypothetical protein VIN04_09695, partial [Myxococcota bacterium]